MRISKEPSRHMKSMLMGAMWVLAAVALFAADQAFAAGGKSAGDIGTQLSSQGANVGKAIKIIVELIGFGMGGFGLMKLIGSFKSHEPKGLPIAMFLIGSLMVVIPMMISSGTQTVLGTDASGLDDIGAGN